MSAEVEVGWRRECDQGIEFVVLTCVDGGGARTEAWITPGFGSNLCRLVADGDPLIDYKPDRLLVHDYTGTPVLYPTPNRVRDAEFCFRGERFRQIKRGQRVYEHGLVHSEAWESSEPVRESGAVALDTWIDFHPASPLFEAFPFRHRLSMRFRLEPHGIAISYAIRNEGDRDIPFGFGLHPYFTKLSGDDGTMLTLSAAHVMEASPDLLPTGRLLKTAGTAYDISVPVSIGSLAMDHVFTGIARGEPVRIAHTTKGRAVRILATTDFSHLVLYSPQGEDAFCVENQTCSTDAHNLYDRGYTAESGLLLVPAGGTHTGQVGYWIERDPVI